MLPIVIYLKVALDGLGIDEQVETLGNFEINRFRYLYVGLPGLDAIQYLQQKNWLGVALSVLMSLPKEQQPWLGAEALQRLSEAPLTPRQHRLLGEVVEAYLPLDEKQKQEFENQLLLENYAGARQMNATSYKKGLEKGREEGREKGQFELTCSVLTERFGELSEEARRAVASMSRTQMQALLLKVGTASSLAELGLEKPTNENEQNGS